MKKSLGIVIVALLFSVPLFANDSINERIKALEAELQKRDEIHLFAKR